MKIFICCSRSFYPKVDGIKKALEESGHQITLPNSFEEPGREDKLKAGDPRRHAKWKAEMLREQERKIKANDAILVINIDKREQRNYVGGATFLEMFKAFELGKKIFLWNDIPEGMLRDEILGFEPIVIKQDLSLVS
ncbi:MAG: hypothetical protein Q8Q11_04100 [bacterium]|nr:hypothetical protein [bacterium]MDZ4248264.1 hypothetical protein [Patescibacteria group bacterium]